MTKVTDMSEQLSRRDTRDQTLSRNNSLIVAMLLISGIAAAASDWVERIGEVVPGNIALTDLEESQNYVKIVGRAQSNADIAALMRAIDGAGLGSSELRQITNAGDLREFVLRVRAPQR